MSRNIVIANMGPGSVKAEVQGRNSRGHFEQQAEHLIKQDTIKVLTIGAFSSVQVIAVDEEDTFKNFVV